MSGNQVAATLCSSIRTSLRRCQSRPAGRSSQSMSSDLSGSLICCEVPMSETEYRFTIRPLTVEEGGGYLIEFPDLPGCMSDGETIEEALANGAAAKRDWIAAMRQAGRQVPPPTVEARKPIAANGCCARRSRCIAVWRSRRGRRVSASMPSRLQCWRRGWGSVCRGTNGDMSGTSGRAGRGGQVAELRRRVSSLEAEAAGLGLAQVMTRSFAGEIRSWSRGMERLYRLHRRRSDRADIASIVANAVSPHVA